jgi:hypothetical protein
MRPVYPICTAGAWPLMMPASQPASTSSSHSTVASRVLRAPAAPVTSAAEHAAGLVAHDRRSASADPRPANGTTACSGRRSVLGALSGCSGSGDPMNGCGMAKPGTLLTSSRTSRSRSFASRRWLSSSAWMRASCLSSSGSASHCRRGAFSGVSCSSTGTTMMPRSNARAISLRTQSPFWSIRRSPVTGSVRLSHCGPMIVMSTSTHSSASRSDVGQPDGPAADRKQQQAVWRRQADRAAG